MGQSRFASLFSSLGRAQPAKNGQQTQLSSEPETLYLARNGWVPNNERLPVLIYRGVIDLVPRRRVASVEDRFRTNWWPPQSLNSIYDFHHFHSTAHEALGVARGVGKLVLGGEGGMEVTLREGDVAVLPAGTGHCRVGASEDFLVVGAYPQDMDWDICRKPPTAVELERIRQLAVPLFDPVRGLSGALPRLWSVEKSLTKAS